MPQGINLTLLIGESVPRPVSSIFTEALQKIEVTHSDEGRSGFQITFQAGRAGRDDLQDDQLVENPLLSVFNRVIMTVSVGATAQVLIDGMITNHQFIPASEPGLSTLIVTGEDVSVMMDLEEVSVEHVAQSETNIVRSIVGKYARYGLTAKVVNPPFQDQPTANERTPSQQGTDLEYLQSIAQRYGYVFYVTPGPSSGKSTAYWGPPPRQPQSQKALIVNMGSLSNVESIQFEYNALAANQVKGQVQDRKTNQITPINQSTGTRSNLAQRSALQSQAHLRTLQFRETARLQAQADAFAKAMIDRSTDRVVTATGELDTVRYGGLLRSQEVVGLAGVGYSYDGLYYVKNVTHTLSSGQYKQRFTLTREGLGTTTQRVSV